MKPGSLPLSSPGATSPNPAGILLMLGNNAMFGRVFLFWQLTGVLSALILWPHLDTPEPLCLWWLLVFGIGLMITRLLQPLTLNAEGRDLDEQTLHHYLTSISAVLAGAAWGSLALIGPYTAAAPAQGILFMVLGIVTLAGAGILCSSRSAFALFLAATLLPIFILSLVSPPSILPQASLWLVIFAAFAVGLHDLLYSGGNATRKGGGTGFSPPTLHDLMLEHASEAILLSQGLELLQANTAFHRLISSAPGSPAAMAIRPRECFTDRAEWRRHVRTALRAVRSRSVCHSAANLRRADGTLIKVELTGRPVEPITHPVRMVWVARDVSGSTDRLRLHQRELDEIRNLIGISADYYWQTDAQHRLITIRRHSDNCGDVLSRNLGRPWWQFHRPAHASDSPCETIRNTFEQGVSFREMMLEVADGDGPPRWLSLSGTARNNEHGAFLGHHGTATDVTERVRGAERIRHLAYHDALTGLPNRRLLTDRLTQAIARAQRYRERVGLIMLDLDDFKRINDVAGHAGGDQALLETADRLRTCVRSCDTVARLGGDEFVVLLAELDRPSDADQVAAKILSALHSPLERRLPGNPISSSIGIAIFPEDAMTPESLLDVADARMYRAKRRGGQRIENT